MGAWLKSYAVIVWCAFGFCAFAGSAMAAGIGDILQKIQGDFAAINAQGEQDRARIKNGAQTGGEAQTGNIALAVKPETSQSKPTQLIVPKDKRTAEAMEAALPTIKKIVSIHQCLNNNAGLREMNYFAVTGVDMMKYANPYWPKTGLPISDMQYHDNNKCLSVQSLDQFSMPALNALLFRAVYFADDSGETANFLYLFKKVDDGSWKLAQLEKGR